MRKFYSLTQQYEFEPTRIVPFSQLERGDLFMFHEQFKLGNRQLYLKSHRNYGVCLGAGTVIGSNLPPQKWTENTDVQDKECIRVEIIETLFNEE